MSPLPCGLMAPRLRAAAVLLAVLLPRAAGAQEPGDVPFESVVDGQSYLGNAPLRIWHRTRGYGEETSDTAFGTHWALPVFDNSLAFVDGQFRLGNNDTDFSLDLGVGYRWRADDFLTGDPRIFGVSFWYDGEDTQQDNFFNQLGFSLERLGQVVDLRLNGNFPIEDPKEGDDVIFTDQATFLGNNIALATLVPTDVPLRVVDAEAAVRLLSLNAWFYGGGYQLDGEGISETGWKSGIRGYFTNDFAMDVGVTDDEQFGTNTVVQLIWTPGRTGPAMSYWPHSIDDRMREHVYRNSYVAVETIQTPGAEVIVDDQGQPFNIVHVNSNAAAGGDGTFENPFDELADVTANTVVNDIILAHANSVFDAENVTIKDAQRFLGEGNNVFHTITTDRLGEINIPETFPGARGQAKPQINNAPGAAAIILAGGTIEVENLDPIEISNFAIDGGTRGVFSPTGVGGVNINEMMISNTTSHGIELTPLVETLVDGTERVRFQPTIDSVMFTGVGGDDIHIDATTTEPPATPIVEAIVISGITSDDGEGVGINLINTKRNITITDFDWDGGTTGIGALRIEDAASTSNVTLTGTNAITGGVTGVAGQGFAIALINGDGSHVVNGTTITNTGGDSIIANDGVADLNFTGFIEQTLNNASILSVENGHDGNLTFTELVNDEGVINATTGDGLQFDDADGVYTFNDLVTIDGAAAAVTVVNDSSAVITIANGAFSDTTGDTITFNGGTANMTFTGLIEQTANNVSILSVSNEHDGTLVFNELDSNTGVINATTGDGLQFDDADGAYTFNDEVTLNGVAGATDTGIDVLNDSEGTFAFAEVDIDYASGANSAVRINGSDVTSFSLDGEVATSAGRPIELTANTGGDVTIAADITANAGSNGILIQGNEELVSEFSGTVELNTGANTALLIDDNEDGSTTFDDLDVTTGAGNGIVVTNNTNHDVNFNGDNVVMTTGGGAGVIINANTSNAAAISATFANLDVNSGAGNAFSVTNNTAYNVTVNGSDNLFVATTGDGVTITGNTNGTTLLNDLDVTTGAGDAFIVMNNTNHTVTVNGADTLITTTGGGAGVNIDTNSDGSVTFASLDLSTGTGNAFRVNDSSSGHTVSVNGADNTIVTGTGTGITMNNAIVGTNVNFRRVSVIGAVNGILLNNVSGGGVIIGAGATSDGDGGTILNTTGNAIDVTDVASLTLNRIDVDGTAAASDGIVISHTGSTASTVTITNTQVNDGDRGIVYDRSASATSRLVLNNVDVDSTAGVGIDIDVTGSSDANITINNGSSVNVGATEALDFDSTGGNKIVRVLVDGSTFTNSSGADNTVDFNTAAGTHNFNITGNTFDNNGGAGGRAFAMVSNAGTVNLDLDGNTATSSHATGDYLLQELGGDFNVVDLTNVDTRNVGVIEFLPAEANFDDIPGPVAQPQ